MFKCTNCNHESDEAVGPLNHCRVCGADTVETKVITKKVETKKEKVNMDLNNDGVVDGKDVSLAAKVMRTVGRKKKRK